MQYTLLIFAIILTTAVYTGLHYYLYRKLMHIFPNHRQRLISALLMLACSLFVVEALNLAGLTRFVSALAWLTYFWMGFIVIFFFISAPLDIIETVSKYFQLTSLQTLLASKQRTIATTALVLLLACQGYFNAQKINLETFTIASEKISTPLRIVQISDLHLGLLTREKNIRLLSRTINSLEPDILVSTGDLVDMQPLSVQNYARLLAAIKATLGKYAVIGNHEVFAGLDKARELIHSAGFSLLSNSGTTVNNLIDIVGVDDASVSGNIYNSDVNESQLLAAYSNKRYTLLLKHQPVVDADSAGLFDLQLSGHTHGGQIFPFGLLTKLVYPLGFGLTQLNNAQWVYVSRGTGTWGPPIRLLAKAEITLIVLRPL
ncbi:MAG: metallophosphoesterase [Gammaproteobacteria bacterium]|nr:metallophosphoesterase [Gammaproteobacteria bacterium]